MLDAVGGVENMQEAKGKGGGQKGGGRKGGSSKSGSGRNAPAALPTTDAEIEQLVTEESGVPRSVVSIAQDIADRYRLEGEDKPRYSGSKLMKKADYFAGVVDPADMRDHWKEIKGK